MNIQFIKLAFILLMLIGFETVSAESQTINFNTNEAKSQLPSHYPKKFSRIAKVGRIDYKNREIVLNDATYAVTDDVWVHTVTNVRESISRLSIGDKVGFQPRKNGQRLIEELWVLPR